MSIFRSSIFLAALVAIAAAGWILSGQFDETATARQPESVAQAASEREVPRTRVRTFVSRAEPYTERLIATAATAAHRPRFACGSSCPASSCPFSCSSSCSS